LFGCFRTRGFCLESTHLQDSARLSKLIALLALALYWAFSSGLWILHENSRYVLSRQLGKKNLKTQKAVAHAARALQLFGFWVSFA